MDSPKSPSRPVPLPSPLTQPFWDELEAGRLAIHRCRSCGRYQHPPRGICMNCGSDDVGFEPVSGRGTLWSWTIIYHPVVGTLNAAVPYASLIVELAEQAGLLLAGDLIDVDATPDMLQIGVNVEFTPLVVNNGSLTIPRFALSVSREGAT
jgi:uncharacterized protein